MPYFDLTRYEEEKPCGAGLFFDGNINWRDVVLDGAQITCCRQVFLWMTLTTYHCGSIWSYRRSSSTFLPSIDDVHEKMGVRREKGRREEADDNIPEWERRSSR